MVACRPACRTRLTGSDARHQTVAAAAHTRGAPRRGANAATQLVRERGGVPRNPQRGGVPRHIE
eukprot:1689076-Pyramimonas_sp.AAC.1